MAAAAASRDVNKELFNIVECSVCCETYDDPRQLPCIHSYCLKCMQEYCKDKNPGDAVACPLCREVFNIPTQGIAGLPKNFFLEQLKELAGPSNIHCDVCSRSVGKTAMKNVATKFCVDCSDKLCETCAEIHGRMRSSMGHHLVVQNEDEEPSESRVRLTRVYCDKHREKVLELFCFDCKTAICMMCFVQSHQMHKCSEINEVADEFRKQMTGDIKKMVDTVNRCREVVEVERKKKVDFKNKVKELEKEICDRADRLKQLIDEDRSNLLQELKSVEKERNKQINYVVEEIEQHISFVDSLRTYIEQLIDKGRSGDVTQQRRPLQDRANELLKLDALQRAINELGSFDVTFTAATWPTSSGDIVGKINKTHVADNSSDKVAGGLSSSTHVQRPQQMITSRATETSLSHVISSDDGEEELYKKLRRIVNELTPETFATLMQLVLDLQIDTEERLKGCIDIIFEKAISVPNFSVAYANMAKRMIHLSVQRESDPTQTVKFRFLLLSKCQHEFEKDKLEELNLADRQKKIDEADSEEKKKLLTEDLVEAAIKSRLRYLGNIRFIGELYKVRLLTEAIMHECLVKLFRSNDEDSLECLCELLTTTGQELDNKQSKLQPRMDMYFKQMDALINEKNKVSARIRFMLLETIDLRKSNWVPRQAREEEKKKQADMQKSVPQRGRRGRGAGARGGRGGPPQGSYDGEDGWNTVTRPPKSQIVDPQRLKLTRREQVDDIIHARGMTTWQLDTHRGGKPTAAPATPDSVTLERLQKDLDRMYQDSTVSDEQVLDYLKENISDIDGKCVRALTTAICSTALLSEVNSSGSDEKKIIFNVLLIKERLGILKKIINGRAELEIDVLFAIQVVIHKKDVYAGAISELVDTLYDEDVVSDATFFRWRDDRMYGELIGRDVAINTLHQFFKWLEEDNHLFR